MSSFVFDFHLVDFVIEFLLSFLEFLNFEELDAVRWIHYIVKF